ncbi:hypothetical protein Bbelb_265710 [Branchiostoma belcheri]|nr:hypothetical protein Bbelb_265710 [Branchiostoma belcheri]
MKRRDPGVNGYLTSVGESRIEVTWWRRMAAAQFRKTQSAVPPPDDVADVKSVHGGLTVPFRRLSQQEDFYHSPPADINKAVPAKSQSPVPPPDDVADVKRLTVPFRRFSQQEDFYPSPLPDKVAASRDGVINGTSFKVEITFPMELAPGNGHTSRYDELVVTGEWAILQTKPPGVWAISSLASFPPIVGWSTYQFIQGKAICTIKWSTDVSYTLFILPTFILLPFFVMIACYYKIFKVVKKNSQRIMSHHRRTELNPTTPGSTPSSSKKSWQPVPVRKDSDQSTGTPRVPPTITIDSADSSDAVKDGGGHDSNKPLLPNHIAAAKSTETTRRIPRKDPAPKEPPGRVRILETSRLAVRNKKILFKAAVTTTNLVISFACKSHNTLTGLALERINEENKGETQGRVRCYSDVSATKKKKPLLRPTLSAKKRDSLDETDYSTAVELKEIIVTNDIILHNPKLLEDSDEKTAIKTHEQQSPRRLSDPFTILTLESKIMKDQSVSQSSLNATMGPVSILRKSSTGSCSGDIESHRRDRLSPRPKEKLSARLSDPEKYNRIRLSIGHVDVERKRSHSLITSTSPSLLRRFQSPSFIRKRQGPGVDDVKVTKILLIVICVFVVCWAPISLVNFVETFFRIQIPPILDITTVYMVFLNCALNPVIYGLMNRNFRDGFKDFFSKCRGKGEHDSSNGKKSRASDGKIV